jgi:hypothetical protein
MSDDVGSVTERSERSGDQSARGKEKEKVKVLYVNNINAQRWHDCFRVLLGVDDDEVFRSDVYRPGTKHQRVSLPEVSLEGLLGAATSFDAQYVFMYDYHLMFKRLQLNQLTHLNLPYNCLGDVGLVRLARGLAKAAAGIQHLNVAENLIGDYGITGGIEFLLALPRLSSLDFAGNVIRGAGGTAFADAVGAGRTGTPWALLSVDLSENEIGEMCGMRWAEVLAVHPTLQFLSLRRTALAVYHYDTFAGLCVAASTAPALSVLDLRDNFASNLSRPLKRENKVLDAASRSYYHERTATAPLISMPLERQQEVIENILSSHPELDSPEFREGVIIRAPRRVPAPRPDTTNRRLDFTPAGQ